MTSVNSSQKRILWVKLPDGVDALQLYPLAQAAGVAINAGPEWSVNKALAEVCRKEFGVPASRPPG